MPAFVPALKFVPAVQGEHFAAALVLLTVRYSPATQTVGPHTASCVASPAVVTPLAEHALRRAHLVNFSVAPAVFWSLNLPEPHLVQEATTPSFLAVQNSPLGHEAGAQTASLVASPAVFKPLAAHTALQ